MAMLAIKNKSVLSAGNYIPLFHANSEIIFFTVLCSSMATLGGCEQGIRDFIFHTVKPYCARFIKRIQPRTENNQLLS